MQIRGHKDLFDQISGATVEIDKRRRHVSEIKLLTGIVRMGRDAANGAGDGFSIREKQGFMRPDTVAVIFANAPEAILNIIDAQAAAFCVEIILRRKEQLSIG